MLLVEDIDHILVHSCLVLPLYFGVILSGFLVLVEYFLLLLLQLFRFHRDIFGFFHVQSVKQGTLSVLIGILVKSRLQFVLHQVALKSASVLAGCIWVIERFTQFVTYRHPFYWPVDRLSILLSFLISLRYARMVLCLPCPYVLNLVVESWLVQMQPVVQILIWRLLRGCSTPYFPTFW